MKKLTFSAVVLGLLFAAAANAIVIKIPSPPIIIKVPTLQDLQNSINSLSQAVAALQAKISNGNSASTAPIVVNSNNPVTQVGNYLGINDQNGFSVLMKINSINYKVEVRKGAYDITRNVYFSESGCVGDKYVESFQTPQSNIVPSIVFYPSGTSGVDRVLWGFGVSVASVDTGSYFDVTSNECVTVFETHANLVGIVPLNIDLNALHPNPTVIFP
jgi:hypothetical protein